MHTSVLASLLALVSVAIAAPASVVKVELDGKLVDVALVDDLPDVSLEKRADPTVLAASAVSSYTPYTWYASAAYCSPASTLAWNCGTNCQSNPSYIPIASGGDGVVTQYWNVGYDPTLKTVIVGHQGTDFSKIIPALTDANFHLSDLDSTLFPGLPSGIQVHSGFKDTHARSAKDVLAAVKKALSTYGTTSVTTVGHSLGGAIALLDAVYLPLNLPSTTTFKSFLYGQPRVGNQAFANYVDSAASKVKATRITNKKDPVPILPGRFLGFTHASGEVHIDDPSGQFYNCPGQDNTSQYCTIGDTPNVFVANTNNHLGPYNGITIQC